MLTILMAISPQKAHLHHPHLIRVTHAHTHTHTNEDAKTRMMRTYRVICPIATHLWNSTITFIS